MSPAQFQELITYPTARWDVTPLDRWVSLCVKLREYEAPHRNFAITNRERKWELVSAFQKAIRRGDKPMALRLISAMDSIPEQYAYFWRRLCVIACEDVGPADDVLVSFVIACATLFPPRKTGSKNYDLFCFLAEEMCDLSARSRIYCSYGAIEPAASKSELPDMSWEDNVIVSAIMQQKATVQAANLPWHQWQKRNDWRAEGLLRFVGLRLPLEMTKAQAPVPQHKIIFGLPSYCYDMHTRPGLKMLRRLVQGVDGAEGITELFRRHPAKGAHLAVGEVLFFVEGARIREELIYEPLCCLEQRVVARHCALPMDSWMCLQGLVEQALKAGVIDRVREGVLRQLYGGDMLMAG